MSVSGRHDDVERDMRDAAKVDKLINRVRDEVRDHYKTMADNLGLTHYRRTAIAKDAATTGLVIALRALAKWDPERAGFSKFVFLKARKIARSLLEKVKTDHHEQALSLSQAPREPAALQCELAELEGDDEVKTLLAFLKPEHAEVLSLRIRGYTDQEISQQLNLSKEGTKSLIRRAKEAAQKLRAGPSRASPPGGEPASSRASIINLDNHRKQRGMRP